MSCDDYGSQRSKRGPRKFTMAQIAQVGCHGNLNMTSEGKSRCEVSVFVQRINSGAREADLRGMKVGGCMWLEQQPLVL